MVAALGFLLLPIAIYSVEIKSAYDSFRAWRVCRSAGAPLVSWVYLFGFTLLAVSMLLPWCLAPFGFVFQYSGMTTVWSLLGAFQTFLGYGAIFSTIATPLAHVPEYLGLLLILWRAFSMFRVRSLLPPSGYSGIARGAVRVAVVLTLFYWGCIASGAVVVPPGMNPLIVVWSLGFLLLPISVYLVEALSAYNSFKVWRAGRVAGV
jgi:hypothetical protein